MSRPRFLLPAALLAGALLLSGCTGGGDSDDGAASDSSGSADSSSPAARPSSTVSVPSGSTLTKQGSDLSFGDTATVIYEPRPGRGTVLDLTVTKVQRGRLSDLSGYILDDSSKKASYFYATVRVKNVGQGDLGGVAVPVWGVDGANTLLPPVTFTTRFDRCPSKPLPSSFGPGKQVTTCQVYLAPRKGSLASVSFRPSQQFDPIAWTGTIAKPAKGKPTKGGKKKPPRDR